MKRLPSAAPLCAILLSIAALSACKRDADDAVQSAPSAQAPQTATEPGAESGSASESQSTSEPAADIADAVGDSPTLRIALLDGAMYELASRRGRWVVLNFWATWCKPCLKEMPDLDAYDAARDDLEVVGLAYEEIEPQDMRAFLKRRPVKYPIAIVDVYDPPTAFGTPRGLPMTYLVAPDGRIAQRFLGPVTSAELDAAIAKHDGKTDVGAKKSSATNPGATKPATKSG
ncbi:MAG: TlpA family protein disulfide reductase [Xanthomonadaceae bacterium]|nr:TlpA family protein disulfide reductase [Xanthomonadaceae bacterium]